MSQQFCTNERHDKPCPLPCAACEADGCNTNNSEPMTLEEAREFIGRYIISNIEDIERFLYDGMQEDSEAEESKVVADVETIRQAALEMSRESHAGNQER